ncbi:hypothetical protein K469DRAFT_752908 [Zopfia rhizophila CBS 207.26]|uniref:Heterokaryon incompatibility domain-containing protein n=1 Tax=Zopfia rhizophila CBS 207.26 TaxID=1314779 RepID=A0A6A6DPX4_9PEZI|nr:hypothetical protein K469DRAFT_752908 [Zopfia rhizophila CBS 207.26]
MCEVLIKPIFWSGINKSGSCGTSTKLAFVYSSILHQDLYPAQTRRPILNEVHSDGKKMLRYIHGGDEVSFSDIVREITQIHSQFMDIPMEFRDEIGYSNCPFDHVLFDHISTPWIIFALFFRHPWFTRGWVFQEAVLAPSATFVIRKDQFDRDFVSAVSERAQVQEQLAHIPNNLALLKTSTGHIRFRHMLSLHEKIYWDNEQLNPLLLLNTVSPSCKFSLLQDTVYGLLGLQDTLSLSPNYALSWQEVFTITATAIIRQSHNLEILQSVERASGIVIDGEENLPSWVPNWAKFVGVNNAPHYKSYDACAGRMHRASTIHDPPHHIRVHGAVVSWIRSVLIMENISKLDSRMCMAHLAHFADFTRTVERLMRENDRKNGTELSQGGFKAMVLVAMRDKLVRDELALDQKGFADPVPNDEAERETELWIRDFFPGLNNLDNVEIALNQFAVGLDTTRVELLIEELVTFKKLANNRNFMVSADGKLGLATSTLAVGDWVCVLEGSNLPVVLKQVDERTAQVLGMCYFDGCMYGEAVTWTEQTAKEFLLC